MNAITLLTAQALAAAGILVNALAPDLRQTNLIAGICRGRPGRGSRRRGPPRSAARRGLGPRSVVLGRHPYRRVTGLAVVVGGFFTLPAGPASAALTPVHSQRQAAQLRNGVPKNGTVKPAPGGGRQSREADWAEGDED